MHTPVEEQTHYQRLVNKRTAVVCVCTVLSDPFSPSGVGSFAHKGVRFVVMAIAEGSYPLHTVGSDPVLWDHVMYYVTCTRQDHILCM